MLDVCLLGTGGMKPLPNRWLTSMLLRHKGKMILTDCGEGTQVQIVKSTWGFKEIGYIFFTHCHADHIAGLPGFLLTLGNNSRTEDVFIYGPPGIQKAVQGLSVIFPQLPFKYKVIELPIDQSSYTMCDEIHVHSLPVDHGDMPCLSYSFELKRKGEFLVEKARGLQIPVSLWKKLQFGEPVMMGNQVIVPSDVLGPDRKGLKISYCTDTRPLDSLVEFVRDSDLFICEGNYAEDNKLNKAMEHGHMIFSEAAQLAAKAKVRELWLTHFSPALTDPHQFIDNAYNFFADSHVGTDLKMKNFVFL